VTLAYKTAHTEYSSFNQYRKENKKERRKEKESIFVYFKEHIKCGLQKVNENTNSVISFWSVQVNKRKFGLFNLAKFVHQ
jgi:hypothetical protein